MGTPQGQCFWLSVFCSFAFWLVLCSFEASFILNCSTLEKACSVIFSSHKEVFSGSKGAVLLSGYYHGFGLRYQSGWMRSCCSSKQYPYLVHTMCPSYLRLLKQKYHRLVQALFLACGWLPFHCVLPWMRASSLIFSLRGH